MDRIGAPHGAVTRSYEDWERDDNQLGPEPEPEPADSAPAPVGGWRG